MASRLIELFADESLVKKIENRLPYLFQMAELESSRAGRMGMEVGSLREKIIVALLLYKFGESNVEVDIPITEPEVDLRVFGSSISIKTFSGSRLGGSSLYGLLMLRRQGNFEKTIIQVVISYSFTSTGAA